MPAKTGQGWLILDETYQFGVLGEEDHRLLRLKSLAIKPLFKSLSHFALAELRAKSAISGLTCMKA